VKILLRCAGRECESALYVPMGDQGALGMAVAQASWIFVRSPAGFQPVCWGCAEKLELSPGDLDRVRQLHAMVQTKGEAS